MNVLASGTCALLPVTSHDLIAVYQKFGIYNGGWVRDLPLGNEDDDDAEEDGDDPNDKDYVDGDDNDGFEDDDWKWSNWSSKQVDTV